MHVYSCFIGVKRQNCCPEVERMTFELWLRVTVQNVTHTPHSGGQRSRFFPTEGYEITVLLPDRTSRMGIRIIQIFRKTIKPLNQNLSNKLESNIIVSLQNV